ncbi:MAG: DNA polymerase IV [Kiritimatiellae bacterium]|nr:DNA polymerase IV [Kiritimatiellia bacterium]
MIILHVDMDAFFASVEQRDHPEWRGKPVIVGSGPNERGVVSTCSYEARKFGVHSAMPSRTAFAKCPEGIFVKPRMGVYKEVSDKVFEVLERFSPEVQKVSIDEAFLDITGTVHLFGGMQKLGEKLRADVFSETGLTCSVGIAPNKLLSKIGSEQKKPNGFYIMPFEKKEIQEWLESKKAGIIWGVGKKTAEILSAKGFRTCGDIQRADLRFLIKLLGEAAAKSIYAHSFGIDNTRVSAEDAEEKSVSREYTFSEDENNREETRKILIELVSEVGRKFREEPRRAKTIKIKMRDNEFNTITRQIRAPLPACDDMTFRHLALKLFDEEWKEGQVKFLRLIGFGVSDFTSLNDKEEPSLFPSELALQMEKREKLSSVLDKLPRLLNNENSVS